jgi:hypothetical protein
MSNRKKIQPVRSSAKYGLYVWKLPNGKFFEDDQGNVLNIPSYEHDIEKMSKLSQAAAYWGKPDGKPEFIPGVGRATEAQYEEDIDRMASGLTPYGDTDAWREEFNNARNR